MDCIPPSDELCEYLQISSLSHCLSLYYFHLMSFLPSSLLFNQSVMSDSLWPHGLQHPRLPCRSPSQSLFKPMSIESVMPSNHLILCCPLLLLPSIFLSIRVLPNESVLRIRWPNYWSVCISPSNEYPRLISFWIDCVDLLTLQGTLKSLLQHHTSKALILWFSPSLWSNSHLYMTTGKIIALIIQTYDSKVILCFGICYLGLS